jgi:hypothetical protein
LRDKEKKKPLAFDDPAEKRGVDELMRRCESSLRPGPLRKARGMYEKCLRGLYRLIEEHVFDPLPETRFERFVRWILRRR